MSQELPVYIGVSFTTPVIDLLRSLYSDFKADETNIVPAAWEFPDDKAMTAYVQEQAKARGFTILLSRVNRMNYSNEEIIHFSTRRVLPGQVVKRIVLDYNGGLNELVGDIG